MSDEQKLSWGDPGVVLALIKVGVDVAPVVIQLFKQPDDKEKLTPMTLEGLMAMGYSMDEATLILAGQMQGPH